MKAFREHFKDYRPFTHSTLPENRQTEAVNQTPVTMDEVANNETQVVWKTRVGMSIPKEKVGAIAEQITSFGHR
jgi:hypothetical protein